jgi:hypothetical protein
MADVDQHFRGVYSLHHQVNIYPTGLYGAALQVRHLLAEIFVFCVCSLAHERRIYWLLDPLVKEFEDLCFGECENGLNPSK